jgi:hypothetical protein
MEFTATSAREDIGIVSGLMKGRKTIDFAIEGVLFFQRAREVTLRLSP